MGRRRGAPHVLVPPDAGRGRRAARALQSCSPPTTLTPRCECRIVARARPDRCCHHGEAVADRQLPLAYGAFPANHTRCATWVYGLVAASELFFRMAGLDCLSGDRDRSRGPQPHMDGSRSQRPPSCIGCSSTCPASRRSNSICCARAAMRSALISTARAPCSFSTTHWPYCGMIASAGPTRRVTEPK